MKKRLLSFIPPICCLVGMLAITTPAGAQGKGQPNGDNGDRSVIIQQAVSESIELFRVRKFAQAETVLFRANASQPGTGAWRIEAAHRLYVMALYLRSHGDGAVANELGERALSQLDNASTLFRARGDVRDEAELEAMRGMIRERLLHDSEAALLHYREAARLNPSRHANTLSRVENAVAEAARTKR